MTQKNDYDPHIDPPAAGEGDEKVNELSYEKATAELEAIVQQLESGELSLEQSVELFQKGMNLAKVCTDRLNEIEARITQLIEQTDGRTDEASYGVNRDE